MVWAGGVLLNWGVLQFQVAGLINVLGGLRSSALFSTVNQLYYLGDIITRVGLCAIDVCIVCIKK